MPPARIVLADDHEEFLHDFAAKLAERHQVVGLATDGEQLVNLSISTKPDLVITDFAMPRMSGLSALPMILGQPSPPKVIFASMHSSPTYVKRALQGGANGYVIKIHLMEQIEIAIRAVLEGKIYLSPQLSIEL